MSDEMDDVKETVRMYRDQALREVQTDRGMPSEELVMKFVQLDLWLKFNEKAQPVADVVPADAKKKSPARESDVRLG